MVVWEIQGNFADGGRAGWKQQHFSNSLCSGRRRNSCCLDFFLKNLRARVAPQPNLCLISDRHASIDSAYNNPENGWHNPPSKHVYCIRHIAQNFMREIKDKFLKNHLVNAGYALNQPGFQYYRREIALTNPDAGRWIDSIDRARWTRSYDDGARWGHMTTNLVESMNGCGVVFFTSPFHLGGRHAKPFTRNLEGECARGGMNFISVLPTISHELSYLSYE